MNEKINLQELTGLYAVKAGITKKEAEIFLRECFDLMSEVLISDGQLKVRNLGSFKLAQVEDRESIDVRTGERMLIPSHFKVAYSPDNGLSQTINEPFSLFESTEIGDPTFEENEESEGNTISEETLSDSSGYYEDNQEIKSFFDWLSPGWRVTGILALIASIVGIFTYLFLKEGASSTDSYTENALPPVEIVTSSAVNRDTEVTEGTNPDRVTDSENPLQTTIVETEKKEVIQIDRIRKTEIESQVIKDESTTTWRHRVIAPGERLTLIALEEYGNKIFWVYLYEDNKKNIRNPDHVPAGLKIVIPSSSKYKIDKNNPESVREAEALEKSYGF